MMKRKMVAVVVFTMLLSSLSFAQSTELKFHNGKFKIAQFTDTHIRYGNPRSDIVFERVEEVLTVEKPDLVMLTGDIVYSVPADSALLQVANLIAKHKIPFLVTFGNHDFEFKKSNLELLELARTVNYNINPEHQADLSGVGNFVLPIKASEGEKTEALIYAFDSHAYTDMAEVKGYDWIKRDQINWYAAQSAAYTEKNQGEPLPALAFFHIPLPEYAEAYTAPNAIVYGVRKEAVCAPKVNSGMFTAMIEAGDVMGTFVGHDHDNDFAAYWKGILLCYGRYSGGNTVYNNLPNGARIIELNEGTRTFETWIFLKGGAIESKVSFPLDFIRKKDPNSN